jgi:hypothetical protein
VARDTSVARREVFLRSNEIENIHGIYGYTMYILYIYTMYIYNMVSAVNYMCINIIYIYVYVIGISIIYGI